MSGNAAGPLPSLTIETARRDDGVVITLTGGATMEHAERLRETLLGLAEEPLRCMVLDVSGLVFISSVGLGAMIAGYLRCKRRRIGFRLAGPRANVKDMFAVTKLTHLFSIYDSVDEALSA